MIRGIHHVALNARNMDLIVDFYRRAFGFTPVTDEFSWKDSAFVDQVIGVEGSAARTLMLKANNVYLEVFQYSAPAGREGEPLRPQDRGYTHFGVDTNDMEADYRRLMEAGMTFGRAIPDASGGIRALYGKDPEGNVIELQQLSADHVFSMTRLNQITD